MRSLLNRTQKGALKSLKDAGGEGAFLKNGTVLVQGVILADRYEDEHYNEPTIGTRYSKATWISLRNLGMVEGAGTGRIRISKKGLDYV